MDQYKSHPSRRENVLRSGTEKEYHPAEKHPLVLSRINRPGRALHTPKHAETALSTRKRHHSEHP